MLEVRSKMEDVGCAPCRLKPSPEIFSDNAKVQQFKTAITHILKHPETTTKINNLLDPNNPCSEKRDSVF